LQIIGGKNAIMMGIHDDACRLLQHHEHLACTGMKNLRSTNRCTKHNGMGMARFVLQMYVAEKVLHTIA
jgi:hypothetical protein